MFFEVPFNTCENVKSEFDKWKQLWKGTLKGNLKDISGNTWCTYIISIRQRYANILAKTTRSYYFKAISRFYKAIFINNICLVVSKTLSFQSPDDLINKNLRMVSSLLKIKVITSSQTFHHLLKCFMQRMPAYHDI